MGGETVSTVKIHSHAKLTKPLIIQGGMGVAVSNWELARAVALTGALGVVSGTALEIVCIRRLQNGDPGGHIRRALAQFPFPGAAKRIYDAYYIPDGKPSNAPFRPVPQYTLSPGLALRELTVIANFVEVFLAKEGHTGLVGINYLRKIELPIPFACYGAMLAGVDFVLVGAGSPGDIPSILNGLASHAPVSLPVRMQGATSKDGVFSIAFNPEDLWPKSQLASVGPLRRPELLAIVASNDLAQGLAQDPVTRPDGFIVEGHVAGGHNAPPRGPRRFDALGQPVYDERDEVALSAIAGLGLPFWIAGAKGTPDELLQALRDSATGIQVGTLFALSKESGLTAACKTRILDGIRHGRISVRTDPRASPTGFPFKILQLEHSLSDENVYSQRKRICDLAILRSPYLKTDGSIGYRCPAEPVASYEAHGGRKENTLGRVCLCNGLLATAGLPQVRPDGYAEPPVLTSGTDLSAVRELLQSTSGAGPYCAEDVVTYLLSGLEKPIGESTLMLGN